ncbi:DoxX family protein [Peristeroidobacter soli]|jgi:uncharacterized membrane protein YphA (DoxX/SURF4 family)|uniref:DoxX family protein n=1 Tax=Peristeroidobacter soli TaxID=2497877 RepID=UPI00101D8423|nr:DoxX family protein [Peristeroidobacter soli]
MQRIFSTFPDKWPGRGLLLLRIAGSVPLFVVGLSKLWGDPADIAVWIRVLSCVSATLLLAGFWTPFAATLQALLEAWLSCAGTAFEWTHLIHAFIGLSLLMLGPGYWSVDARRYGRKRIVLEYSQRPPGERDLEDP